MLFEFTHQSVHWNLEALSITGTSTSDNQTSWEWHSISSAWSIAATPGHQNCSPPNSNIWVKSSAMCLRLSSLPTWTGAMVFSWAGHGKLPEVWKNPRHKDRQHHSQLTLPSCHYIPCGPSQRLPHPRSPTHHLCPTCSTLVITFLSPTLCHTHPPSSSHSTFCPHTLLLPSHSSVHPSLSPCITTPCVPPSAPSTA